MAIREIYPLTEDEASRLDKLRDREGVAWDFWRAVGEKFNINFNPSSGKVAFVERVGHLAFRVTWHPRRIRSQHIEVGR